MEKEKRHSFSAITAMVIGVAVIYILLGLAKILIPEFKALHIVYIAGFVLDIFGIILIVKYCLSGGFRDLGKYEFSCGVLCLLCGILMNIRATTITKYFYLFIGICILLTAIIKLQDAVDLRGLEHGAWFIFLILSMLFIVVAVLIILNPLKLVDKYGEYVFYLLIVDGAYQIFSKIFLAICLFVKKHKKEKPEEEDEDDEFDEKSIKEENIPENPVPKKEETIPENPAPKKEETIPENPAPNKEESIPEVVVDTPSDENE